MLLQRTISQLDVGHVPDPIAENMAHLGYAQWLGALKGEASYIEEAKRAHDLAHPFAQNSPAIAVFCQLLTQSTATPPQPLDLKLPVPARRGGARARRSVL